ncbi:ABC-type bacteriocin/lantibiotic exporter with double-glycine peptidase domain [Paraburkholderia terricola]|uniref:cysteine peptidase family C39 domain-containing protein n=1 Tax=Paraburkholderia terricola TaxID=169427 RepID=UPI00285E3E55|nr:cysteine peptidase family C39 domain-containing protein [Paraburkholderia terricola]MDR6495688.1 ABC-type bacteriocin/lantibiotic exporter with double-glycine peptidase domain [Paraburkholderia terricola]
MTDPEQQTISDHDPGLAALVLIARFHGIAADAGQLRHAAGIRSAAFTDSELALSARSLGIKTRKVRVPWNVSPVLPSSAHIGPIASSTAFKGQCRPRPH